MKIALRRGGHKSPFSFSRRDCHRRPFHYLQTDSQGFAGVHPRRLGVPPAPLKPAGVLIEMYNLMWTEWNAIWATPLSRHIDSEKLDGTPEPGLRRVQSRLAFFTPICRGEPPTFMHRRLLFLPPFYWNLKRLPAEQRLPTGHGGLPVEREFSLIIKKKKRKKKNEMTASSIFTPNVNAGCLIGSTPAVSHQNNECLPLMRILSVVWRRWKPSAGFGVSPLSPRITKSPRFPEKKPGPSRARRRQQPEEKGGGRRLSPATGKSRLLETD